MYGPDDGGYSNWGDNDPKSEPEQKAPSEQKPQSPPSTAKMQSSKKPPQHVPSKQALDAMHEFRSKSPEEISAGLLSRLANGDLDVIGCAHVLSALEPHAAAMAAKTLITSGKLKPDEAGK